MPTRPDVVAQDKARRGEAGGLAGDLAGVPQGFASVSFVPRGAFEDLAAVPGDVDDVHFGLARSRDQKRLARELIHRPACLVPGDVQSGYADPPVLGDADDTQVEQRVVQSAESQPRSDLIRPFLAVPADVRRLDPADASAAWRRALKELLGDKQRFDSWRKQRYALRTASGRCCRGAPAGSCRDRQALYGVYLPGSGLCYVGQTQEAKRRLRDLPIGESHHLAMTAPPELWTRVIVVQWAELLVRAAEREWVIPDMKACGQPFDISCTAISAPRSTATPGPLTGAIASGRPREANRRPLLVPLRTLDLFKAVLGVWSDLEAVPEPASGESGLRITARSDGWSFLCAAR